MRTAILAALLAACASSTPPADGPAAGWLDVDDGRGPQPLTECTWDVAWSDGGDVLRLFVRAEPFRLDATWPQYGTETRSASYNDCAVVDGITMCSVSGSRRSCSGTVEEGTPGTWQVDMACDDGSHVTAEVTSCERL